jgi:hypothetical protein
LTENGSLETDHGSVSSRDTDDCGVSEEQFPQMLKCCIYSGIGALQKYQSICPHCKAWTSLPNGLTLEVATIFECSLHGYGKRVKEK